MVWSKVFARMTRFNQRKSFEPGEIIYRFPGKITRSTPTYQTIQIGVDHHTLDFGVLANINHSCDPNTFVDAESRCVTALRFIAAGDDLTFFYPSTEWDMVRPFVCQCHAPQCLRFVAGAKYLDSSVLALLHQPTYPQDAFRVAFPASGS